jgi:NAD+ diphosphatase
MAKQHFPEPSRPGHNYFSTWFMDRMSDRRRDDAWIAAQLKAETTRFIPVWQLKNLFTAGKVPQPVFLSPQQVRHFLPRAESTVLLGVLADRAYFAIGLRPGAESPPRELAELGEFRDLRWITPLVDEREGALLAYARAMTYWHGRHCFCGVCGSPTRSAEAGCLRVCTNSQCGQHHFPHADPAIIVLVARDERCLLIRKSWWPEGLYSNVSGFVEPGESLEDAVVREVQEETGVKVQDITYHSSQPWPFPSALMLSFRAVASEGPLRVDETELESARWFTREEMRSQLKEGVLQLPTPIAVSYRLLEDWFDAGSFGRLRSISGGLNRGRK